MATILNIERSKSGRTGHLHDVVEQAYESTRNDLYYYVLKLGLPPGPAQEVAQEVFLRLYLKLREGEQIESVRGWLFRVAHNLALNQRRENKGELPLEPMAEARRSPGKTPEEEAIASERTARLEDAVSALSPQQRQCLHLRAEGLRYHEIAAAVGISPSSVNEFLRRAIARLRKVVL